MQRRGKQASTTELLLETVLCNQLLGNSNSWTTTIETGVFSMWSAPRSYLEDSQYPCGGEVEYLHRTSASRRTRRRGKTQIWDSKIW
jgi:hypothetical protein